MKIRWAISWLFQSTHFEKFSHTVAEEPNTASTWRSVQDDEEKSGNLRPRAANTNVHVAGVMSG